MKKQLIFMVACFLCFSMGNAQELQRLETLKDDAAVKSVQQVMNVNLPNSQIQSVESNILEVVSADMPETREASVKEAMITRHSERTSPNEIKAREKDKAASPAKNSRGQVFFEGFETGTGTGLPTGWTQQNLGTGSAWARITGYTGSDFPPHSGTYFASNTYSSGQARNVWMFSPGIALTEGVDYNISFWLCLPGYPTYDEYDFFEVKIAESATAAAMTSSTTTVYYNIDERLPDWTFIDYTFTPSESGTYYIGFHAFSPADEGDYIAIDDILVFEPIEGVDAEMAQIIAPNSGVNLSATEQVKVLIKNNGTDPLTGFNVELKLGEAVIATEPFTGTIPSMGRAEYTFTATLNLFTAGTYQVTVTAIVTADAIPDNNSLTKSVTNTVILPISEFPWAESFDGTTFPPEESWTNISPTGAHLWARTTAGVNPTVAPRTGAGMIFYNCWTYSSGSRGLLITPPIDVDGKFIGFSFWMYRNTGSYNANLDRVNVYVNGTNSLTDATLLTTINRSITQSPVVTAEGWYKYTVTLPTEGMSEAYVILEGWSAYGHNIFVDDFELFELPENDLSIISAAYPYSQVPIDQVLLSPLTATVKNVGLNAQTNVVLSIEFNGTVIGTSTPTTIAAGDTETLSVSLSNVAIPLGLNTVVFTVTQNETDQNPADNTITRTFTGTPNTFATDNGTMSIYYSSGTNGNIYTFTKETVVYQVSSYFYTGGAATYNLAIYEVTGVNTINTTELFSQNSISKGGTGTLWHSYNFATPLTLPAGSYYFAISGTNSYLLGDANVDGRRSYQRSGTTADLVTLTPALFVRLTVDLKQNDLQVIANGFPYTQIPLSQAAGLTFPATLSGKAYNAGTEEQTNITLSVDYNGTAMGSSTPITSLAPLATSADMVVTTPTGTVFPTTLGTNNVTYTVSQSETEQYPADNTEIYTFDITENVYAIDGPINLAAGGVGYTTANAIIGNYFTITNMTKLDKVMVAFSSTSPAIAYNIRLYNRTGALTIGTTPIFSHAAGTITPGWSTIEVPTTILLPGEYFLCIQQTTTTNPGVLYDGKPGRVCYGLTTGTTLTQQTTFGSLAIRMVIDDSPNEDATIFINPTSLALGTVYNNWPTPYEREITIMNVGAEPLTVNEVTTAHNAITVTGLPVTLNYEETATITVTLNHTILSTGSFSGSFVLESNDIETPELTVPVTATVATATILSVIDENWDAGAPAGWAYSAFSRQTTGGVNNSPYIRANIYGSVTSAVAQTPFVYMGTDPEMSFAFRAVNYSGGAAAPSNTLSYGVFVTEDGGANWTRIHFVGIGEHISSDNFATIEVDVSAYANKLCMFQIVCQWATGDIYVGIDDVLIGTILDDDLEAVSVTGVGVAIVGVPVTHTVVIKNAGFNRQDENTYSVKLMQVGTDSDIQLGTLPGVEIEYKETKSFVFNWIPTVSGDVQIYGEIVFADDQNLDNNKTNNKGIFVFEEGMSEAIVGNGTATLLAPYNIYYRMSLSQTLYLPSELETYGGDIYAIKYTSNIISTGTQLANLQSIPVQIWIGETDVTSLANNTWVSLDGLTEVFDGILSFPAGVNDIIIHLNEPYRYNGGNLVVYSYRKYGDYGSSTDGFLGVNSGFTGRTIVRYSDSGTPNPTNPGAFGSVNQISGYPNTSLFFDLSGLGSLSGVITYQETGDPADGVLVKMGAASTTTNTEGEYSFLNLNPGSYNLTITKQGYYDVIIPVTIAEDGVHTQNAELIERALYKIYGTVTLNDVPGVGVEDVAITIKGGYNSTYNTTTDEDGYYEVEDLYDAFTYTVTAVYNNAAYVPFNGSVALDGADVEYDIMITEILYPVDWVTAEVVDNEVVVEWGMGGKKNSVENARSRSKVSEEPIVNPNNLRGFENYIVYRAILGQPEANWLLLGSTTESTYADNSWTTLPTATEYQYAVKAVYTSNIMSAPTLSNIVPKGMYFNYTVNITSNADIDVTGAFVKMTNQNEPTYVYSGLADEDGIELEGVRIGTYNLLITLDGHEDYTATCVVSATELTHNAVLVELIVAPFALEVEVNEIYRTALFKWNEGLEPFFDDFESYDNFIIEDIGPYTLIDVDGSMTWGIDGVDFPNSNYEGSFIVFNPSATTPAYTNAGATAYSGSKYLACFDAILPDDGGDGPNDDWLILPKMKMKDGVFFKFMAKSHTASYGLERFRVGVSTTGTDPANFTIISDGSYVSVPATAWTPYSYDMSAYAEQEVYIAINCVSNDAFFLMIDDISVDFAAKSRGFVGYNVYLDDVLVAPAIPNTQYLFTQLAAGTYEAGVQAVYSTGTSEIVTIPFELLTNPITVTGYTPANDALWTSFVEGTDITARINFSGNITGSSLAGITVNGNAPDDKFILYNNQLNIEYEFEWDTEYEIVVPASAIIGYIGADILYTFTTPEPLSITTYAPLQDATGVALNAEVSLVFNQNIVTIGFGTPPVTITKTGGGTVTGVSFVPVTPAQNSNKLVINHNNFEYGSEYTVSVNWNVVPRWWQIYGESPITWSFTTVAQTFEITAVPNNPAWGSVTGGGTFVIGDLVSLVATPTTPGYHFVNWTEGDEVVAGAGATYTFNATADRNLVANFAINTYTVTLLKNPDAGGTVTGGGTFDHGTSVSVEATATGEYSFQKWTYAGGETPNNPYTFTVTSDVTLTANFSLPGTILVTVTVDPTGAGTVSGAGNHIVGDEVTLTATPNAAYNFKNWTLGSATGQVLGTALTYTFEAETDVTIYANFEIKTYTITASVDGDGGSISHAGPTTVNHGGSQTYIITPNDDYEILNVLVDGTQVDLTGNQYTFTNVISNHTIVAKFIAVGEVTYTITATVGDGDGTITPSGEIKVAEGGSLTFTMTPAEGWKIELVLVDGINNEGAVAAGSYTFTNVNDDHAITVIFEKDGGIDMERISPLSVYPNPTNGKLFINSVSQLNTVRVYDASGRLVMDFGKVRSTELSIEMGNLASGVYFVMVDNTTVKVVKQ